KMYGELLIGFFFILILSDSRNPSLKFAADIKDIFIVLLSGFVILQKIPLSVRNNPVFKFFLPFFILAVTVILLSDQKIICLQKTASYILRYLTVPVYLFNGFDQKGKTFFRGLLLFIGLILFTGLVMKYTTPELVHIEGRFSGLLGNP